jgi:hypothetical protein
MKRRTGRGRHPLTQAKHREGDQQRTGDQSVRLRQARLRFFSAVQSFRAALLAPSRGARITRSMDDGDGGDWR